MLTQKKKTFKEKEITSKKHFDTYPKRTMLTHNK
jgi:hypothetical protein